MKPIYENTVKGVGDLASAFAEEKTIIYSETARRTR